MGKEQFETKQQTGSSEKSPKGRGPARVAGIGASAGGLEALRSLFSRLEDSPDIAFVVVQHLAPNHKSRMAELIAHETALKVSEVRDGDQLESSQIYVCPPNKDVVLEGNRLVLKSPGSKIGPKPSVDLFFHSLAKEKKEEAIGIILSGTGTDGSHGARAIKANGGLVLAQSPQEAKYDGMPRSALQTGAVDLELDCENLARNLEQIEALRNKLAGGDNVNDSNYRKILNAVKRESGVDFHEYKDSTIQRRIQRRMLALKMEDDAEYARYLEKSKEEAWKFYQDALISVTSFYRDKEAFDSVRQLLERRCEESEMPEVFRCWAAGCATGEEAYSLSILLTEVFEKKGIASKPQVFATDLDEKALAFARKGCFPKASFEKFPKKLLEKYFVEKDDGYQIRPEARDTVVFAKHNLAQDPPFLSLDLIVCRNVLIYFDKGLQEKVLSVFHYALNDNGILFLGKSESVSGGNFQFEQLDKQLKLYQKLAGPGHPPALAFGAGKGEKKTAEKREVPGAKRKSRDDFARIKSIIEGLAPNSVLLDAEYNIRHIFGKAGDKFKFSTGKATQNILRLTDKRTSLELSALLHKAATKRQPALGRKIERENEGALEVSQVKVLPLRNFGPYAFLAAFELDRVSLESSGLSGGIEEGESEHVKKLQQELGYTRQYLQNVIEEHETANEELQSLNEELQSTNEELQSSNEELETTNEELQSSNEELTTLNQELNVKSGELQLVNQRLEAIQSAIVYPLVILDEQLKLAGFNQAAKELLRLKDSDAGHFVKSVPISMEIAPILEKIEAGYRTNMDQSFQFSAKERKFEVKVQLIGSSEKDNQGCVVSMVENTEILEALEHSRVAEERMANILENIPSVVSKKNLNGEYTFANQRFCELHRLELSQVIGSTDEEIFGESAAGIIRGKEMEVLRGGRPQTYDEVLEINGEKTHWTTSKIPLFDSNKRPQSICSISLDITKRKVRELQLEMFQKAVSLSTNGVAILDKKESDYIVSYVSDELPEAFELDRTDLRGFTCDEFFKKILPEADASAVDRLVEELENQENASFTFRVAHLSGAERWMEFKGALIRKAAGERRSGKISGIVFTVYDVTEKIDKEKTISQQQDELMRFGRYASLGEISAGFAHEINTPLNVIMGNLDLLTSSAEMGELDAKTANNIADEIEGVVENISRIVRGLKSMAGDGEQDFSRNDIRRIIQNSLKLGELRLQRKALKVETELPKDPLNVWCSEVQIMQILVNLINNAVDAVSDLPERWLKVSAAKKGAMARIKVVDSGAGIDRKLAEKIMTPFFSDKTQTSSKGTGIGLSLSRSIAKKHRGDLYIDHEAKNTTFVLELPLEGDRTKKQ